MLISLIANHKIGCKFLVRLSLIDFDELSGHISDWGVIHGGKPPYQCKVVPPIRLAAIPDRAVHPNKWEASICSNVVVMAFNRVDFPVLPCPVIIINICYCQHGLEGGSQQCHAHAIVPY